MEPREGFRGGASRSACDSRNALRTTQFPDSRPRFPIENRGAFSNSGFSRAFGPHASHAFRADAQTGCHSAMTAGALLRAAARSFASNRSSGLAVAAQQVRPRAKENDPRIREAPLRRDIFPDRPFGVAVRANRRARNAPPPRFSTSASALVPALVFAARLTDARAHPDPLHASLDDRRDRSPRRRRFPTQTP